MKLILMIFIVICDLYLQASKLLQMQAPEEQSSQGIAGIVSGKKFSFNAKKYFLELEYPTYLLQ